MKKNNFFTFHFKCFLGIIIISVIATSCKNLNSQQIENNSSNSLGDLVDYQLNKDTYDGKTCVNPSNFKLISKRRLSLYDSIYNKLDRKKSIRNGEHFYSNISYSLADLFSRSELIVNVTFIGLIDSCDGTSNFCYNYQFKINDIFYSEFPYKIGDTIIVMEKAYHLWARDLNNADSTFYSRSQPVFGHPDKFESYNLALSSQLLICTLYFEKDFSLVNQKQVRFQNTFRNYVNDFNELDRFEISDFVNRFLL